MVSRNLKVDIDLIMMELCALFPPEWLRRKAKETDLIKRERKIDPVYMFWSLSIGYGVFLHRTLAALKRDYERYSNQILSDSSCTTGSLPSLWPFSENALCVALNTRLKNPVEPSAIGFQFSQTS